MPKRPPVLALLTDFGARDHYVGVMKGVILSICPTARIIDLSHEVEPQRVEEGAYQLWASYPHLPPGAVVLGVVDPGVGTSRRILLVKTKRNVFIAPDNGLLDFIIWQEKPGEIRVLDEEDSAVKKIIPRKPSKTFHGRDLFAPIAAHLARGTPLPRFGKRIPCPVVREPFVRSRESSVVPRILHIDHFGNIITNMGPPDDGSHSFFNAIEVGGRKIDCWIRTYEEGPPETPCLIVGSSGLVEIVVNKNSAASLLQASPASSLKLIG